MPKRKRSSKKEGGVQGGVGLDTKSKDTTLAGNGGEKWSKSKKKRMRAKLAKQHNQIKSGQQNDAGIDDGQMKQRRKKQLATNDHQAVHHHQRAPNKETEHRQISTSIRAKSALQQSFLARLSGSRFRELNEDLYTTTSDIAFKRFSENPELFDEYHEGFRKQVSQWPVNPVDVILRWIRKKGKQSTEKRLTIADFGCGDAKLAQKLASGDGISRSGGDRSKGRKSKRKGDDDDGGNAGRGDTKECNYKVHSFDLVSNGNPWITPCDMSNVPLESDTVDIGVFCLALMGTNIADFVREAHRVLRPDGVLKIAEVRSRFEATAEQGDDGSGKSGDGRGRGGSSRKRTDDRLLNDFIDTMVELGFQCTQKDRSTKMFILMEFAKTGEKPSDEATFTAKPCIYKRR
mmetsp:Transcript_35103/g.76846  ORF Transcript_35103/g.76846 Transcript_35103/m.76846 type:complete len:403 (-) Transcript_35103:65-1273(-)